MDIRVWYRLKFCCPQTIILQQLFFYQQNKQKIMLNSSIFDQFQRESLETYQSIAVMRFCVSQQQNFKKSLNCYLLEDSIVIEAQEDTKYVRIEFMFELKCLIKENNIFLESQKKQQNRNSYFELYKNQDRLKFEMVQDQEGFKVWKQVLQRKLMQYGFYDNYTPINMLGQGNFAKIFLLQNNHNKQYIAVKPFSKNQSFMKQHGKQAFINEITIMRMFNHENILKIKEVYENEHSLFVCMELLSGGNLMQKINEKVKFNAVQVKAIMKSLILGLQELHSKNIMHRDLKPENILFRYYHSNECVIGDLGLAESQLTQKRLFKTCGTLGFVAPEILKGEQYDSTCDMFSLGVILHMILLGKPLFQAENQKELCLMNKRCQINFDDFEYRQLPETWLNFMKELLEADPKKRLTATQALAHKFFKKEPLVKKKPKPKNDQQLLEQLDIENKINIHEFDQILKKRANKGSKVLKRIQNNATVSIASKQSSQRSVNSKNSKNSMKSKKSLKNIKKPKHQQSKFKDIAYNNS